MSIDGDTTKKVSNLARLALSEGENAAMTEKLNGIMQWIEQLQEVDTDGVEPLAKIHDTAPNLRADAVTDGGKRDDVLANAAESLEGYFVVGKVIE